MTKLLHVVLDTNVALSALVFAKGRLAPLRQAWQTKQFVPLISTVTATELIRVLAYPKFKLNVKAQEELLADYLPHCKTVRIPARPPKTPNYSDPFDIPFLQLAAVGKASYLVSSDNDLLELRKCGACQIITAEQFFGLFF